MTSTETLQIMFEFYEIVSGDLSSTHDRVNNHRKDSFKELLVDMGAVIWPSIGEYESSTGSPAKRGQQTLVKDVDVPEAAPSLLDLGLSQIRNHGERQLNTIDRRIDGPPWKSIKGLSLIVPRLDSYENNNMGEKNRTQVRTHVQQGIIAFLIDSRSNRTISKRKNPRNPPAGPSRSIGPPIFAQSTYQSKGIIGKSH